MPKKTRKKKQGAATFRPVPGEDYRFTVGSAEEAADVIRKHLGPEARVCSVKQVEGKGLSRFFASPRLEVIARIPIENGVPAPEARDAVSSEPAKAVSRQVSDECAFPDTEAGPGEKTLPAILRRAGFSNAFLARVCDNKSGGGDRRGLTAAMLREVADSLAESQARRPVASLGQRVAFVGTAGVGKTTALCKWLAAEVFIRQKAARVLIQDGARANIGGPLDVFCEVLGVPVGRSSGDGENGCSEERLYIDFPGVELGSKEGIREMADLLDREFVTGRILVLNAAYDAAVLKESCRMGEDLGFTHLVLTHVDEVRQWGKLLEAVVCSGVTPLFLSEGPDVAGGIDEQPFARIVREAFPCGGRSDGVVSKKSLLKEIA